uniref:BSD domain-containing protein 1 isoform X1 n=2 Tax=Ciona intestinalis TaxID=7719 RepID=UPI000180B9B0|nr:BSD domain-containing protein 1 isoform X1 [Ciona intestinalis]|eukprot:XP_002128881.1 BSD domain-containing protein 1 isoform X1 [Ciona intestinalis]
MATKSEEEEKDESANSWWGSWYDSAKKKLVETNEFIARDLKEFTQVVKDDTSKFVAQTAISMKDQLNIKANVEEASEATKVVATSISGFLGSVVKHVTPSPPDQDENADSTMFVGTQSGMKVISPAEARLFSIQTDPATYCNEPDNTPEFHQWLETFELSEKKEELSLLMLDYKEVRTLYTRLVPDAVSHVDFWQRYFYKKYCLDEAEKRRALLVERAAKKETELSWGDDDDYDCVESDVVMVIPPVVNDVTKETDDVTKETDDVTKETDDVTKETDDVIVEADDVTTKVTANTDDVINKVDDVTTDDVTATNEKSSEDKTTDCDVTKEKQSESDKLLKDNDVIITTDDVTKEADCSTKDSIVTSQTVKVDCDVINKESDATDAKTNVETKAPVSESTSNESSDWEKEFDLELNDKDELLQDIGDEEIEGWDEWE